VKVQGFVLVLQKIECILITILNSTFFLVASVCVCVCV